MGENTKIEWADSTFNFWTGCTKVSESCDHCYAESWAKRSGHPELWQGERRRTTAANWRQPFKWDSNTGGVRQRVFTNSLADFFDNQIDERLRLDAWDVIRRTRNLDWLILTKRPQNISKMLPEGWGDGWPNVWLGTTVENQEEADRRLPHLRDVPAVVKFLSMEPLLGPVKLWEFDEDAGALRGPGIVVNGAMTVGTPFDPPEGVDTSYPWIDWVIVGGESGGKARPFNLAWARDLVAQCKSASVPVFVKQMGARPVITVRDENCTAQDSAHDVRLTAKDRKGGDWSEWPEDLRVREVPNE
jgi:protein gp37